MITLEANVGFEVVVLPPMRRELRRVAMLLALDGALLFPGTAFALEEVVD